MPEHFMTAEEIRGEFGMSTEGLPVMGIRMVDGEKVELYQESDAVRSESTDG